MYKSLLNGLFYLSILLFLFSCRTETAPSSPTETAPTKTTQLVGLATPIQLNKTTTRVIMEDYFMEPEEIDTIFSPKEIVASISPDKQKLILSVIGNVPPLSTLSFQTKDGNIYSILLKAYGKTSVTMTLPDKQYETVQVKGEMNAWNPNTANFEKKGANWTFTFELNPGNYQYLYVVDGKEMKDPSNAKLVSNGIGGFNNLLEIPKPDPEKIPTLFTKEAKGNTITIGFNNTPSGVLAFWENALMDAQMTPESKEIRLTIPEAAADQKRSFVRVWAFNEEGESNDLLIPLQEGKVVEDAAQLNRFDKEAQIMYFTLVDRFNNGNKENDEPVEDDRLTEKTNFQGGDIAGITQKIKDGYLKSLNINAIWLSPITQNPLKAYQEFPEPQRWYSGYHGYWPVVSSKVDHRFGTSEELKEMVTVAHDSDINILLDYVCNHVHQEHSIYQEHPEWATQLDLPNGQKNIRIWDEQRLTTWFDTFLPSLDFSNPEVVDLQSDSAMWWVLEYNLDGYRHDATKHINLEFWRTLTRKLKEEMIVKNNKPLYQIGETYGSRDLINSYINSGMLDSQFDFNLYFEVRNAFALPEPSFEVVKTSLEESFNYYGYHSTMGYMTGNHDQPRFISYASGALSFDEDARAAGFERDIQVEDTVGYERLQMLTGFLMSIPGVPVIFYGDEIGMSGAGDPDNRRMMRFDAWNKHEAETKKITEQLTDLRANRLSLTYGDTELLEVSDKTFALARMYFDELTIAVFNKDDQERTIQLELPERYKRVKLNANFGGKVENEDAGISVTLPPRSFDYLTN